MHFLSCLRQEAQFSFSWLDLRTAAVGLSTKSTSPASMGLSAIPWRPLKSSYRMLTARLKKIEKRVEVANLKCFCSTDKRAVTIDAFPMSAQTVILTPRPSVLLPEVDLHELVLRLE